MAYTDINKKREYQKEWTREKFSNPDEKERRQSHRREKFSERLKQLNEYKQSLSCTQCGENHPACLDFHHIDPNNKLHNISQMIAHSYSWKAIQEEINKCIVLCANCHRKLHYNESNTK